MSTETKEFAKPECTMVGENGNVFNLIGIAGRALKKAGYPDKAKEMSEKVFASKSYDDALVIMQEYVEIN